MMKCKSYLSSTKRIIKIIKQKQSGAVQPSDSSATQLNASSWNRKW